MQDAMSQWLNAIRGFDDSTGQIHMGPHGPDALDALGRLPDDLLLTLRQTGRQGWMTPEHHAEHFRVPEPHSHTLLAQLEHYGLLEKTGTVFVISDRFAGGIHQTLQKRGWAT